MTEPVTVERIEAAIRMTVQVMRDYPDLAPKIMPTLRRLKEERDRLRGPLDEAARILAQLET